MIEKRDILAMDPLRGSIILEIIFLKFSTYKY